MRLPVAVSTRTSKPLLTTKRAPVASTAMARRLRDSVGKISAICGPLPCTLSETMVRFPVAGSIDNTALMAVSVIDNIPVPSTAMSDGAPSDGPRPGGWTLGTAGRRGLVRGAASDVAGMAATASAAMGRTTCVWCACNLRSDAVGLHAVRSIGGSGYRAGKGRVQQKRDGRQP